MSKLLNKLIWLVVLAPGIYLVCIWNKLPDSIPLHFDIKGNADRYGVKKELLMPVILLSVLSLFVYFICTNAYRLDPKRYAAENKSRLQRIGFAVAVFLAALVCMIIYTSMNGGSRFDISLVLGGVGLLFAIIGNYMPNMKPNYFAGLRLPWTLEDADNWKKTHAFAGKLWFAGSLFLTALCLILPSTIALIIFFSVTLLMIIIPSVYSYRLYKKKRTSEKYNS